MMHASEENITHFQKLVRSFAPCNKPGSQASQSKVLTVLLRKTNSRCFSFSLRNWRFRQHSSRVFPFAALFAPQKPTEKSHINRPRRKLFLSLKKPWNPIFSVQAELELWIPGAFWDTEKCVRFCSKFQSSFKICGQIYKEFYTGNLLNSLFTIYALKIAAYFLTYNVSFTSKPYE